METRKWTFANVVLVRGQSYSIGTHRFVLGRNVRVVDSQLASLLRGNTAFSVEDHWAEDKPLAEAFRTPAPEPPAAPPVFVPEPPRARTPEPPSPEPEEPTFEPAAGVPVGAFVVTTETKPAGKKVLKKRTKVEG